jgi:predicted O-methyltransferase YrrM
MDQGQEQWAAVDAYLEEHLVRPDPALTAALETSAEAGLPSIQVTPCQGKFLQLLARIVSARRILELGTLGGYSTIWLGRALPEDGCLITVEVSPQHAEVARRNIARADLSKVVELRVGSALEILPALIAERQARFDLIFIDADKVSTPEYFRWALKLARVGTIIVVDNVVRKGALADAESSDGSVQAMRAFIRLVGAEAPVSTTVLQTVGSKGYDGFALALVTSALEQ